MGMKLYHPLPVPPFPAFFRDFARSYEVELDFIQHFNHVLRLPDLLDVVGETEIRAVTGFPCHIFPILLADVEGLLLGLAALPV